MSIARQASEITLPAINDGWDTVLQFLCSRFPFISEAVWRERMAAGKVYWFSGDTVTPVTPFLPSKRLCYYREVAAEPVIPLTHHIIFQNEHIIVADKPHFLPVTPGGDYVNECLLARLQHDTGSADIVPVHRLDRDTAGLVLFSVNPDSRAAYYQLFSHGAIEKQYQAVARLTAALWQADLPQHWHIENRIEKSQPRFINAIVAGEVNAVSDITLVAKDGGLGMFELTPQSGKTHQLRLHMLSLGMPILYDNYYPQLLPKQPPQFATPLQLLAKQLSFTDPVSGQPYHFCSKQLLSAWPF
ncbi:MULTISPECIES: pseudouridine synthase [unclassified Arsukibacterium]|uniref:pseudouridine synthase n=1 Tax=unclassified Arsukibacterium TaxID=2635278 RepID=UPI000C4A4A58|nr:MULTISPECIES: pseudouridine synthase [unclassified Arsukibacterium]MAA96045.1 pseudouridine synthase [Rheinheimera sp.]MBM34570.1 pseudouridine synthase [Rheinheimera sp.]HAW94295.1 pseudouridine synthase [Candidatus Azambacteria bacterium]|tara:strand:+ start:465737 stop:466639 length:903 start_codon:yes stop_codon:yes gene_type:complete